MSPYVLHKNVRNKIGAEPVRDNRLHELLHIPCQMHFIQ
jgi:hypothetical protein